MMEIVVVIVTFIFIFPIWLSEQKRKKRLKETKNHPIIHQIKFAQSVNELVDFEFHFNTPSAEHYQTRLNILYAVTALISIFLVMPILFSNKSGALLDLIRLICAFLPFCVFASQWHHKKKLVTQYTQERVLDCRLDGLIYHDGFQAHHIDWKDIIYLDRDYEQSLHVFSWSLKTKNQKIHINPEDLYYSHSVVLECLHSYWYLLGKHRPYPRMK